MVDNDATASGSCAQSRPRAALGLLNFFSADIRDGFMPLLGAYLIASEGWTESMVGALATTMTVCGLLATTPAGDVMDKTKCKRLLIGGCTLVCTVCFAAILVAHDFTLLLMAKALTGLSPAVDRTLQHDVRGPPDIQWHRCIHQQYNRLVSVSFRPQDKMWLN